VPQQLLGAYFLANISTNHRKLVQVLLVEQVMTTHERERIQTLATSYFDALFFTSSDDRLGSFN
jgi:hypothetical protein